MLFFAALMVSTYLVHGAIPEEMPVDDRTPKDKCKDWKFPKSSSSKSTKVPKTIGTRAKMTKAPKSGFSETCYCPCCNEDSCQELMDAVEGDSVVEGLNDGTGPFCAVAGPRFIMPGRNLNVMEEPLFKDKCWYNENGDLDPNGADTDNNLAECCDTLGIEHSFGCVKRSRRLNEASASNKRAVTTHEDGVTVEVKVAEPNSLDWIHAHVAEMKERMERGDVAREWDPLFQSYFDNSHQIDMNCNANSADSLSCKYSSQSQCGRDLISAHAGYHKEIADSIRTGGSHKIATKHLKPDSCQ